MGNIIETLAFVKKPPTYDTNISYLIFVKRQKISFSFVTTHSIPVRYYHVNNNYPTLLICHGNNEDIGESDVKALSREFTANICIFDYAGYGLHTCKFSSEAECEEDVIAVYNYLIYTRKIIPEKIVIYGRSLGTGLACYLAHHVRNNIKQPYKLILVSPLTSAVGTQYNIWLPGDIFMNYRLAPHIKCSTLILHGDQDDVVPYSCGVELSQKFPNLYKFCTLHNRSHNDLFTHNYYEEINTFLRL